MHCNGKWRSVSGSHAKTEFTKVRNVRAPLILPAFLGALVALCPMGAGAADQAAPAIQPVAPRVTVAPVRVHALMETISVTGTVVARDEMFVGPEIDGLNVVELLAEEGDLVVAGQVLARLRRDTLDAQLLQNDAAIRRSEAAIQQAKNQITQFEASLKQAQQALDRTAQLRKSGFASQAIFDQQTNEANVAAARLEAARDGLALSEADRATIEAQRRELMIRIARTEVKAPAAGLIARRTARVGGIAAMAAAEPMFRLIARGELELEAEVPASRIGLVQEGVPATINAEGRSERGQVRLVSPEVDRQSRLGRIRVALGKDTQLKPGMFARAVVETRRANGLAVPQSALLYGESGPFVQIVENGTIVARPVRLGIAQGTMIEIVDGLKEGQNIVVRAGAFLRAGDAVTPVEAGSR